MHLRKNINEQYAPCDFYGGAFWPRFKNEGSGCSAFGMAMLEIAQVLPTESKDWLVKVNVPMTIIGGEYNQNKRIKNSTIKKTNSWYIGKGKENEDYVAHFVYEPSIMFDWVLQNQNLITDSFVSSQIEGVPGIYFDKSNNNINASEPIFNKRAEKNLFIETYHKKYTSSNTSN